MNLAIYSASGMITTAVQEGEFSIDINDTNTKSKTGQ